MLTLHSIIVTRAGKATGTGFKLTSMRIIRTMRAYVIQRAVVVGNLKHTVKKHVSAYHKKNKQAHGEIHIHPKHAKPYRKRHIGALILLSSSAIFLVSAAISYDKQVGQGLASAKEFIRTTFNRPKNSSDIHSSYGFNLTYDPQKYFVAGIDGQSGDIYTGDELGYERAYQTVRISRTEKYDIKEVTNFTLDYEIKAGSVSESKKSLLSIEDAYTRPKITTDSTVLAKTDSVSITLGGIPFQKSSWTRVPKSGGITVAASLLTYTGIVNDKPLVIVINNGITSGSNEYDAILSTITFGQPSVVLSQPVSQSVAVRASRSRSLIDRLLMTQFAQAASNNETMDSEDIVSRYSPAVVKIYNVYCKDIAIGLITLRNACNASTGSGFIVGSDGYIATNGHVATQSAKDVAVSFALLSFVSGSDAYLRELIKIAGVTESDYASATSNSGVLDIVFDKIYKNIPDSDFKVSNEASNLIVDLGEKQPDVEKLLSLTEDRKTYPEESAIKQAKVVKIDYRAIDGLEKFYASDVALLKVSVSNAPVVKLGSISDAGQGSNLSILGFPGSASQNGLVDSEVGKVTLTSGKVSSIKNAKGSTKKVIETDTTIGHGNSGGPVFGGSGSVVGLATYTIDGSGSGDGVYNYVRDVQDLKDIVSQAAVKLSTESETQTEWEKGLTNFGTSHYSKSLKSFEKVKQLYPAHAKVAEYISNAQAKIKAGEDVKDFPIVLVGVGAAVALAGVVITIIVMMRHHGKHQVYKVMAGNTMPHPQGFGEVQGTVQVAAIPGQVQAVPPEVPPTPAGSSPQTLGQPTVVAPNQVPPPPPATR